MARFEDGLREVGCAKVVIKATAKAYKARSPYADPWIGRITPAEIFDSYAKNNGAYLFIWINKTAGVSITKVLGIDKDTYNHYTASELRGIVEPGVFDKAFTFCFVRNPWDKVVSEFRFRVWTYQNELTDDANFADWVRAAYLEKDPKYHDWPKMFLPQLEWITDENGDIMIDFVGRFERLQADFDHICDAIGVKRQVLPHGNKSRDQDDYRRYYDDETKAIVEAHFKADIDYFGYRF